MKISRLVLLFFLVVIPTLLRAQSYSYLQYSVANGLTSTEVYQVFQDRSGFMWFATDNGVTRFDGNEMQTFNVRDGLPDPVIFGFYEDLKGRLWFRSFSGRLSWFENGEIHKYPYNDTLTSLCQKSLLYSIFVDSKDQLWIGGGDFSGSISPDGKISIVPNADHALYFKNVEDGFIFGHHWPSSLVNAVRVNDHVFPIAKYDKTYYYDNQTVCAIRWMGDIYISMRNMILRYDGKTLVRVLESTDHIINMSVDRKNKMWVGYREKGVDCFENPNFENPLTIDFLAGKTVTTVLQDDQDGYWISTIQSGVYYIPNFAVRNHSLPLSSKITIALPAGNKTLLGNEKGTVMLLNNKTLAVEKSTQLKGTAFASIFIDSRKNIWASTSQTAVLLDSSLKVNKTISFQNDFLESDGIVYGLSRTRLLTYNMQGDQLSRTVFPTIYRNMLNSPPFILINSRTGLDVFDQKFNFIRAAERLKDYKISKLLNLDDSTILVSTIGNGFFVVNKYTWKLLSWGEDRTFIGENIYTALIADSSLWLGTEKGIAITSVKSLLKGKPAFVFLDVHSGLVSNKISLLTCATPNIFAFSDQGFSILPMNTASFSTPSPKFYLKNTLVNDQQADLVKYPELPFSQNNVQINFGFISYKNQHVSLRSRLKSTGLWDRSNERSLKFYSLAPGNYEFELQYSTDMVQWQNALPKIKFQIMQPWWQKSWIQATVILIIMMVFYLVFRAQMVVLQHRNARLKVQNENRKNLLAAEMDTIEKERSRVAKDLHDGIGMNLTVLKLKLHQLLDSKEVSKNHEIKTEANDVYDHINSTIQEIRDTIRNLTPSGINQIGLANALRSFIEKNTSHLEVLIDVHDSGEKITEPRIGLTCFRIMQELISNSLKHANASMIMIDLTSDQDSITIQYGDNGKGFSPESVTAGNGLLNIEARLEQIQGKMEFSSGSFGVSYQFIIPIQKPVMHISRGDSSDAA